MRWIGSSRGPRGVWVSVLGLTRFSHWTCVPMAEHREPCEPRSSRTVLGTLGGEILPGDTPTADYTVQNLKRLIKHAAPAPPMPMAA